METIKGLKKDKDIVISKYNRSITASYWKIGMITINDLHKEINFNLCLYLNEDSSEFIESFNVNDLMGCEDKSIFIKYFEGNNYPDIRTACYQYVLDNVEFFNDAIKI